MASIFYRQWRQRQLLLATIAIESAIVTIGDRSTIDNGDNGEVNTIS